MEEIAQAFGISHGSISIILHDHLGMRKLTTRWVPKSLSDEQMATRASVCSALLKRFRSKDDFLLRLVTVDETWVHYYEPENKAQSRQWVGPGSPRPKKFKTQPSVGDGHSIFGHKRRYYVGRFTQEKYNNWSVLCKLVRPTENRHHEKRRGKLSKGVLLQQDNARVPTCKVAMDAVERNGYELNILTMFEGTFHLTWPKYQ